ncbi:MAG: Hpt domain-containing protein [Bdellovibrionales bacterium]|nr:Hpt domain-containing protein [Bdellovibrionales bacterium]
MSFTDLLSQLKVEYVSGLPAKITTIREHLASEDLIALRTDFHKLKGNGKTYGLPEISELAALVESHCLETPESALGSVETAVELLEDIFQHRQSDRELNLSKDPRFQSLSRGPVAA